MAQHHRHLLDPKRVTRHTNADIDMNDFMSRLWVCLFLRKQINSGRILRKTLRVQTKRNRFREIRGTNGRTTTSSADCDGRSTPTLATALRRPYSRDTHHQPTLGSNNVRFYIVFCYCFYSVSVPPPLLLLNVSIGKGSPFAQIHK